VHYQIRFFFFLEGPDDQSSLDEPGQAFRGNVHHCWFLVAAQRKYKPPHPFEPTTHRLIHRRFERCILVPRTCVHPILSILFIHNNTEEKCLETRAAPLRRAQGAAAAPDGPWN